MPQKGLKASLTAKIFLVTCLVLLLAAGVTFGLIAWATPISYVTVTTDALMTKAQELCGVLSETDYADAAQVINEYIRNQADLLILASDGTVAEIPGVDKAPDREAATFQITTIKDGENTAYESDTVTTDTLCFAFRFADRAEEYTMCVLPRTEAAVNQTVQALGRVAPWLLGAMLIFSVLCALFYSRWITRPVVRLSKTSRRMAQLDFSWRCEERRGDEIGTLGRSLNELSDRLSASLEELRQANAKLTEDIDRERELDRQRLEFFSAVSHELKTPVTILQGQLTGMLEGVGVYSDREKYLAKSIQVTGRMEALISEILTVSRMESDGFTPHRTPLELSDLLEKQLALDEELILEKRMTVERSYAENAEVLSDERLLRKVLDNLLSNAVFYAPEGAALRLATYGMGDGYAMSVENTGSHIPEEAVEHVFEAFYRADSSRNRATGGSGLGLYVVRLILDRLGCEGKIENTDDGVKFTVIFRP